MSFEYGTTEKEVIEITLVDINLVSLFLRCARFIKDNNSNIYIRTIIFEREYDEGESIWLAIFYITKLYSNKEIRYRE